MRPFSVLIPLALMVTADAAAFAPHAVTTKDVKPGGAVAAAVRSVFPCDGHDVVSLAVFDSQLLTGDTTDGPTDLAGYACTPWAEAGPERIYQLDVTRDLELWAGLVDRDPAVDLDLFLLDGCDTDACLVGANTEFTALLPAGTYYLVVDGYGASADANAGPFTVSLETRALGLPAEVCTVEARPEACTVGGGVALDGNLAGRTNWLQAYDCNASETRSGDAWYALDLLPGQAFTARTSSVNRDLDLVLWLFADCGPEAVCLAAADDSLAGQRETLTWQSDVADTVTVYLGVDAVRAPADSAAGDWSLIIDCGAQVPDAGSSFGGLKALFR